MVDTKKITKTYVINNQSISCDLSNQSELCSKIQSVTLKTSYNLSIINKLTDEYKCANSYIWTKKATDEQFAIKCSEPFYQQFFNFFLNAKLSLEDLNNEVNRISNQGNNLYNLKPQTIKTQYALENLKTFTKANQDKIDSAFEKALFDTNAMGFLTLVTFPLSMWFVSTDDKLFHHKIDRVSDSLVEIYGNLEEIDSVI
jgi:hypothetical protein